jgi:hypothetical protein
MTIPSVTAGDDILDTWGNAVADAINGMPETGTYSPTLANVAIGTGGNAENTCFYTWLGGSETGDEGVLTLVGSIILGSSGASVTGGPTLTLPSGFQTTTVLGGSQRFGKVLFIDANGSDPLGHMFQSTATVLGVLIENASGTYVVHSTPSSTVPFTWVADDRILYNCTIPAVRV